MNSSSYNPNNTLYANEQSYEYHHHSQHHPFEYLHHPHETYEYEVVEYHHHFTTQAHTHTHTTGMESSSTAAAALAHSNHQHQHQQQMLSKSSIVAHLVNICRCKKWDEFHQILSQFQQDLLLDNSNCTSSAGQEYMFLMSLAMDGRHNTLMHYICMNHPPLQVLQLIICPPPLYTNVNNVNNNATAVASNNAPHIQQEVAHTISMLRNNDGQTPLHMLCKHKASAKAVDFVLNHAPSHASTATDNPHSWTPLHTACRFNASLKVIKVLLQHSSQSGNSLMATSFGGTPIHLSCWFGNSMDVLKVLLEDAVQYAGKPAPPSNNVHVASHLLTMLWTKYCRLGEESFVSLRRALEKRDCSEEDLDPKLKAVWGKVVLVLQSLYSFENHQFNVLHAITSCAPYCPRSLMILAVKLYGEEDCQKKDVHGRTPLAILASHYISTADKEYEKRKEKNGFAIRLFTNICPDAVSDADLDGRLPLNLALEMGKDWSSGGVDVLFEAFPDVIQLQDPVTRMQPFMTAAVAPGSNLNTVFELLRRQPNLVQEGIPDYYHRNSNKRPRQEGPSQSSCKRLRRGKDSCVSNDAHTPSISADVHTVSGTPDVIPVVDGVQPPVTTSPVIEDHPTKKRGAALHTMSSKARRISLP